MTPTIPPSPFGPQGGMATARPDLYPSLFTKRPDGPTYPHYDPPGALMLASEALALLAQLSAWGVPFPALVVYELGGNPEKTWAEASPADPARRRLFSAVRKPDGLLAEHDLMLVREALSGKLSSCVMGLAQIAAERGIPPITLRRLTDAEIVAALQAIFG